jgi:hypothetical protein
MILQLAFAALFIGADSAQECTASASAPALDHTIIVVNDLEAAATAFHRAGLRVKRRRLHTNGLLNRHIKFRDGSEVELMTVQSPARDELARDYADLLEAGDGGVYVALRVRALTEARRVAAAVGLDTRNSASGAWQFVGFPPASPAAAVFFTSGQVTVQDADSVFAHEPPVSALTEVWVEGGAGLRDLLRGLGAVPCGHARSVDGREGQRWTLSRGSIVVVQARDGVRPRVLGAVLESSAPVQHALNVLPGFWLQYR